MVHIGDAGVIATFKMDDMGGGAERFGVAVERRATILRGVRS